MLIPGGFAGISNEPLKTHILEACNNTAVSAAQSSKSKPIFLCTTTASQDEFMIFRNLNLMAVIIHHFTYT